MRQTLRDFGYNLSQVPLLCDNESATRLADNPAEHSRTKHIDIRHHFLRDHQQKGDIEVYHISTENQLADIFTKPLDEKRFCRLRSELNVLYSRNLDWSITSMCSMPLIMSLYAFKSIIVYLWCSSCTCHPRTSQVYMQMVHILRGRYATTWPFETYLFGWVPLRQSQRCIEREKWTWTMQRLPLHSDISVFNSKFILMLYLPFALNWHFWWGNGVKGPKMIPFWCLMPKGEKLRPKQMDQPTTCEFWK
jgi:hypothetical protein